jgi:hypothetical protein
MFAGGSEPSSVIVMHLALNIGYTLHDVMVLQTILYSKIVARKRCLDYFCLSMQ